MLGTMKFLSELYKQAMLSRFMIYSILDDQLGLNESASQYPCSNHSVEAAVCLINKLGSKLEQETSSKTGEKKAEAE